MVPIGKCGKENQTMKKRKKLQNHIDDERKIREEKKHTHTNIDGTTAVQHEYISLVDHSFGVCL